MATASRSGQMAHRMKVTGRTTWLAERESSPTQMGMFLTATGRTTKPTVKALTFIKTELYSLAFGRTTNSMDPGRKQIRMVQSMLGAI